MSLGKKEALELYRKMLFFRRFEEQVNMAYMQQKFSGFCHLHIGQEAVCVGIQHCLTDDDYLISGYRSHTQAIAKGIPPQTVMAELLGRETGCSGGRGGSMHMFSSAHKFLGGHGIVGGQAPLAAGVGFAINYRNENALMVCYLGDAATNQGQVFEAMNMCATWDLPVLFVIENNKYGMGTDIRRTTSVDSLAKRALAFDMEHSTIDGMDLTVFLPHVQKVVKKVRDKKISYLLEANTYRFKGHSVSDPATYRTKDEVKQYQDRDPLVLMQKFLKSKKFANQGDFDGMDEEVRGEVKSCLAEAEKGAVPNPEDALTKVFVGE